MTLYKVLGTDLRSCHGGEAAAWVPGEWQPVVPEPVLCKRGWHLLTRPRSVLRWWVPDGELWEAEGQGARSEDHTKTAWESARILRRLHMPTLAELVLLAADFAEHILPVWEAAFPSDPRPRQAIEAARFGDRTATHYANVAADVAGHAVRSGYDAASAANVAIAAAFAAYAASDAAYAASTDAASTGGTACAYAANAAADAAYAAYAAYAADAAYATTAAATTAAADAATTAAADAATDAAALAGAPAAREAEEAWQDARVLEVISR